MEKYNRVVQRVTPEVHSLMTDWRRALRYFHTHSHVRLCVFKSRTILMIKETENCNSNFFYFGILCLLTTSHLIVISRLYFTVTSSFVSCAGKHWKETNLELTYRFKRWQRQLIMHETSAAILILTLKNTIYFSLFQGK